MKVEIERPIEEVFAFAINPKNTPKWIDGIVQEETNEWPIKEGSIYRNKGHDGKWSEYLVAEFEENKIFKLSKKDSAYNVKYIFKPTGESSCEMKYHEWVDEGELEEPFTQDTLDKFRVVIERNER